MARMTVVPGVFVDQLEVETPPYDEPGVVQEYVGKSLYRKYEVLQTPEKFGGKKVQNFLNSVRDQIGPLGNKYRIVYHLKVKGSAERFARSKARTFTRLKNPFEPSKMSIRRIEQSNESIDEAIIDGPQKVYNVQVSASK